MIGNESEYGRDQLVVEVLCVSVEAQPVLLLVTKIYSEHTRSAAHRRLAPRTPSNESLQMINPSNTVLCSMERIASSARAAPTIYNPYLASFSLHSQILSDCQLNNVHTAVDRVHRTTIRQSSLYGVCRSITDINVNLMSPSDSLTDLIIVPVSL